MKIEKFGMPFRRRPMQVGDVVVRVALLLLCLVMVSAYMTSGLLARYTTSAQASDTARVAKFDVQVTGNNNVTVTADSAADNTYTLTITNASEVAVRYTVQQPAANGGVSYTVPQPTDTLAPGDSAAVQMSLTVNWDEVTRNMTDDNPNATVTFTVVVDIQQIN